MKNLNTTVAPNKKRNMVLTLIVLIAVVALLLMLESNKAKYNYAISIIERSLISVRQIS